MCKVRYSTETLINSLRTWRNCFISHKTTGQCLVEEIRLESQDIPHVLGREKKITQSSCSDQVPPKYLQKDTLPERIQKEDVALAILWDMSAQLWGSLATFTSYLK